ncbi:MAG TPA: CRISPR-associated endonuclease Cas2 [Fibrobacteraceae bacterium]|nr:CRISPR-associated endonuclease Cas2 [Fibrobacteraceae bacterium]
MRRRYLVTYDIADDKRLKKVFKAMKDYGDHLQFSVFLCDLNDVERIRMESSVKSIMNEKDDQVLIVDLGQATQQVDEDAFYAIGRPLVFQPRAKIA